MNISSFWDPWTEQLKKWFAQRHEGTKKLLRIFVPSCEPKFLRARKCQTMDARFRGNDQVWIMGLAL